MVEAGDAGAVFVVVVVVIIVVVTVFFADFLLHFCPKHCEERVDWGQVVRPMVRRAEGGARSQADGEAVVFSGVTGLRQWFFAFFD